MSCEPELVTGLVDGELGAQERARLEAHLAGCPACARQAAEERELRGRLRALAPPELPAGLVERARAAAVRPRRLLRAVGLPLAAALVLGLLVARGAPRVLALQLARDHAHCFSQASLPAKVWSDDARVVAAWLRDQGQAAPPLPERAAGLELIGARRCPLLDRRVAHVYYADDERHLSVYLVPGSARVEGLWSARVLGRHVQLRRLGGQVLALVSEDAETLAAFARTFESSVAGAAAPVGPPVS